MKRLAVPHAHTRSRNGQAVPGRREWLPHLCYKLLALLIEAYLREALIVGAGVNLKDVLHTPDEGGILLWRDGPLSLEPGLYGTFLRVRLTSSREMGSSAQSKLTNRSAKSLTLHLFLPLGGSEQASAIKWASCSPSSFLGLVFWAGDGGGQPPSPPRRTSLADGKPSSGSPPGRLDLHVGPGGRVCSLVGLQ